MLPFVVVLVFEVWNGVGVGCELEVVLEGLLVRGARRGLPGLVPALLLPEIIKQHLFNYNLPPAKLIYPSPGALPGHIPSVAARKIYNPLPKLASKINEKKDEYLN